MKSLLMSLLRLGLGLLAMGWIGHALAAPLEVAGVKMEDRIVLADTPLLLNGAGVRYKLVFKVYVAGLYLKQKASTPEEALAAPGPKRILMTMLRDIDTNELGKLFTRGIEDNMEPGSFRQLIPDIVRMGQMFARHKSLKAGESIWIDWILGTGTILTVKGKVENDILKDQAFYNALLRIWLGPKPADHQLKDALLDIKKSASAAER